MFSSFAPTLKGVKKTKADPFKEFSETISRTCEKLKGREGKKYNEKKNHKTYYVL